jgi:CRP-like cAMP-binding protein
MKYEFYLKGETIFYQGDNVDYMYIILTGKVLSLKNKSKVQIISEMEEIKT